MIEASMRTTVLERPALLEGRLGFNLNAGSGRRDRRAKNRNLLLEELLGLGWVVIQIGNGTDDDETVFAKHFISKYGKHRNMLQLLSSPSFGTGLYVFALRQHTFDIREVQTENGRRLKICCRDFDAYPVSVAEFATEEEMGRERFLRFLLERGFMTEEERKYFDRSESSRRKLAQHLPVVIMDLAEAPASASGE